MEENNNNRDQMNATTLDAFLSRHINTSHSTSERRVSAIVVPSEGTISLFGEDLVRNFDAYGRALPTRRCFVRESLNLPITVESLCVINDSHAVWQ